MAINIRRSRALLMLLSAVAVAVVLSALTVTNPAEAEWWGFSDAQDYPVGESPIVVTSADFDGDGKKDLATVNYGLYAQPTFPKDEILGSVAVLLGNGDGTFQPKQEFEIATNPHPRSLASARFNGDDFADLVVPNPASGNVAVLLGKGDGTFQDPQNVAAGLHPLHATSADFDGNGSADLVVVNKASDDLSILLGNDDGSFQDAKSVAAGDAPESATKADLDGNGTPDLVVLRKSSDALTILLGNGDGTFQDAKNLPVEDETYSITSADLNGDEKADLATAHHRSFGSTTSPPEGVSVLLSRGDGTFQSPKNYPVSWITNYLHYPEQVVSADFNRDNKQDLATSNRGGFFTGYHGASVLLGKGDGTFEEAQQYTFGINPSSLTASDFDGDSFPDLAVADEGSNDLNFETYPDDVSVLMNMPGPTDVTIDSGPPSLTNSATATFGFSSPEPGVTFECSLDGGAYEDCASPQPYTNLTDGYHTFEVIALGAAGSGLYGYAYQNWTVDTTAPPISTVSPTDQSQNVSLGTNLEATFSETMNDSTLTTSTFTLTKQNSSTPVAATVSYSSTTNNATLNPSSDLASNTTYTATIKGGSTGAKDSAGNALAQDYSWTFTTAPPPDTTAPRVSTATPTGTGVARGTNATATFSERMDPTTITTSTFKLFKCSSTTSTNCATQITNVGVSLSTDRLKATLNPYGTSSTLLAGRTKFKMVVTAGAKDEAGNQLDQDPSMAGNQNKVWYFTTGHS